jgi:DNA-binding transcriptional LysR family regulator
MGLSTSHVSRAIARVEDRLGARLFNRTTRRIVLTDVGRSLLERTAPHLEQLDEAEAHVTDRGDEPRGRIRVTVPVQFGTRYVAPLVGRFAARYPNLAIELCFDDQRVDLVAQAFDVAVRVGRMTDSSLLARKLGQSRNMALASAAYLSTHGIPRHPRDLTSHEALVYSYQSTGPVWRFTGPDGEHSVRVDGRFTANNAEGLLAAAVAGVGIARLPDAVAADKVRTGQLLRILVPWETTLPVSAVYPAGPHQPQKVRCFVDFLAEELAPAPWLVATEGTETDGSGLTADA